MLSIIFKNNRLDDYADILQNALNNNYVVCSVSDYYEKYLGGDSKHYLILRHDVDYLTPGTRKMFLIEKKYKVKSTYYFRDNTLDVDLAKAMLQDGFEVGYHYETIAHLMQRGTIKNRPDIKVDSVREEFKEELTNFQNRIGSQIKSCAAHGAPENIRIGVSNNIIFEDIQSKELGVEFEAYNIALIDSITSYISDSGIMHNYGFQYAGDTPFEAIQKKENVILFLTHPNHWYLSLFERIKKLVRMIIGKGEYDSKIVFSRLDK